MASGLIGNKQILLVKPHLIDANQRNLCKRLPIFMQNISSRDLFPADERCLLVLAEILHCLRRALYSGGLIQPLIYGQADAMRQLLVTTGREAAHEKRTKTRCA